MAPDDFDRLVEAVRELVQSRRLKADQVVINHKGRPVLILPITAAEPELPGRNLPLEILKVLREAGTPLTGVLVLEALERRGVRVSKRTVDGYLADMVSDGSLQNPPGAKPAGYRPAE